MPHYKLLTETGEDLAQFQTSMPSWEPGDRIPRGMDGSLEVVYLLDAEADEQLDGYLVVKPLSVAPPWGSGPLTRERAGPRG
jgi:hypothetical protein